MTAGRRPLVIALAAALLVIVGLLIALIAAGGGNSGGSHSPTPQPSKPADPRAPARAAIEKTAVAYQRALDPTSPADPCRYMTPEAADDVMVFADPRVGARGCKAAARESERRQSQPLYAGPAGVTNIRFLPRVPVAGIQGTAAGAQGTWRADPTRSATFVERRGQWLIAK
jgi:hypothetical protein